VRNAVLGFVKKTVKDVAIEQCGNVGAEGMGVRCRFVDRNSGNELGEFILTKTASG
jgi:hypothetical protein